MMRRTVVNSENRRAGLQGDSCMYRGRMGGGDGGSPWARIHWHSCEAAALCMCPVGRLNLRFRLTS